MNPDSPSYQWWVALTTVQAGMISGIDGTAVGISIPSMMVSLRADLDQIQWVVTISLIIQTLLMPMTGWLTGLVGSRILFVASLILFNVGTVLCGLSLQMLPEDKVRMATGLFSVVRGMAGTFGVALSATFLEHRRELHAMQLAEVQGLLNMPSRWAKATLQRSFEGSGDVAGLALLKADAHLHNTMPARVSLGGEALGSRTPMGLWTGYRLASGRRCVAWRSAAVKGATIERSVGTGGRDNSPRTPQRRAPLDRGNWAGIYSPPILGDEFSM